MAKYKDEITVRGHSAHCIPLAAGRELTGAAVFATEASARARARRLRADYREIGNGERPPAVKVFQRTIRADRLVLVLWVVTVRPQEGEEE